MLVRGLFEAIRSDETQILISLGGSGEYDAEGNFVRVHCQFQDITERKRYETFVTNSSDIILLHDESGDAAFVSPSVEREMGYDPETLVGKNPFPDIHPEDRDRMKEVFSRILTEADTVQRAEYRIQAADGSYVWVESRGKNLIDEGGISGVLLNTRVIDERKDYEQELERQNQRLDTFASVVSHDLRNPLQVGLGHLELAKEECESDHLDRVARAHDRMEMLVDDLLSLARAGESVGEPQAVEVASLAKEGWQNVETGSAQLCIEAEVVVRADETRFQQLFENLFRNAVEHAGDAVTVRVGGLERGFFVEDDGPGIPDESRETVFETGYSEHDDGTGLGLNIVQQVAEAHDWEVRVTDGSTGGARFEFSGVEIVSG